MYSWKFHVGLQGHITGRITFATFFSLPAVAELLITIH